MNLVVGALLAASAVLAESPSPTPLAVLDHEKDPQRLVEAAVAIVAAGDARAIGQLAQHLGRRSFLQRLDPGHAGEHDVRNVGRVFRALAAHPSAATETLCVDLARNPEFTSVPVRLNLLLNALAAVRPVSERAARVFLETGRAGYLEVNGPLLARNASVRALEVLEALLVDDRLDVAQRVSVVRWGVVPVRTDSAVLSMCSRLALSSGLSPQLRVAIIESLFDYQPRRWFGVAANQPTPAPWPAASKTAKQILRSLGEAVRNRADLPPDLRAAIQVTMDTLQ